MAANIEALCNQAMEAGGGILRLAPNWVPRSFLHPGRRIKLHPRDYYALGTHRGGIDERWFASTTEAANDNREEFEGLSFAVCNGEKFLLRDAVDTLKGRLVGDAIWNKYQRWPVYSKFFDNMGPIPHHMHQREEDAKLVGQEGKPEAYYFPPHSIMSGIISPTRSLVWNRVPPSKISSNAWNAGTKATTEFWIIPKPTG